MNCIAFSAECRVHTSYGNDDVMDYDRTIINEGNHWDGTDFTAPSDGCYFFSLSFVKDSYYANGTTDDVNIKLYHIKNGNRIYIGKAWAGEGDGRRATGAFSVTLKMSVGDQIKTYASSDGGRNRHIAEAFITGYKIA